MTAPAPASAAPTVTEWAHVILGTDGPWSILADTGGHRTTLWAHTHTELATIAKHADGNRWVGMARRFRQLEHGRGTAADCAHICALWVDLDHRGPTHATTTKKLPPDADACWQLIHRFPIPPTSVIATGGGLQPHWALAEPLATGDAIPLLERWGAWWTDTAASMGWHVDSVWDIARVMRLPDTRNHKADPPIPVTHLLWEPQRRWGVDDIDQWLPEDLPAQRPRLAAVAGYVGPDRPGDHFAAAHSCGEILERNGWSFHHRDARTGDEHWTRPGKHRRHGASATVYAADGRCVIWTDQAVGVNARESLNPFRLFAKLEHAGDFGQAARTLATAGYGGPDAPIDLAHLAPPPPAPAPDTDTEPGNPDLSILINWHDFWAHDPADENWLAEPLIPAGRSIAIHAPGGTGKSLIALHIAATLATGTSCIGKPPKPAVHVLYLDYEMTPSDLAERLEAMGFGPDSDLSHLHYAQLPPIHPLDTPEGATTVHALAVAVRAELVVIDTYARAVAGDENEADTVRAFYRHTGSRLKAAGIAVARVDHTGKDIERGARGSSAKRDDVDIVWAATKLQGLLRFKAEKTRMSWVPQQVDLDMVETDGTLTYRVRNDPGEVWPDGMGAVVADMVDLGIPTDASVRAATAAFQVAGRKANRDLLRAAVKFRKRGGRLAIELETDPETGRHTPPHAHMFVPRAQEQAHDTQNALTSTYTPRAHSGTQAKALLGTHSPSIDGECAQAHPTDPLDPFDGLDLEDTP